MNENYKSKLLASAVTAVLVFSSLLFISGAQATPSDDLEVSQMYEPDGTPPPRANIAYDIVVEWANDGSSDYDATVRLYEDCDLNTLADESDSITMSAGEEGMATLSITFGDTGEVCFSGTIYYSGTDYGEFENYINVEPETGDADLSAEFQMEGSNFAAGENVNVVFEYGNEGTVSTLHPVTVMAYFDPVDDDPTNSFSPSPFTFNFISPPPPDAPPESERMEWPYTIPGGTADGKYKFTVIIDSEQNNTEEDTNQDNNVDVWEVCVGDCSEADLVISESSGLNSLRVQPEDGVAGMTLSFFYAVENQGEGDALPPGPFDDREGNLTMGIEVMKCPDEDCTGQIWVPVNTTAPIKTPINSGEMMEDDSILGVNWSTSSSDAGWWNIRIVADYENVIEESSEANNNLEWFKIHSGYFNLAEQRPDLMVAGINEGTDKVYQDDERIIQVAITQTSMGDAMADGVEVYLKMKDPDLQSTDWFQIDEAKTVGLTPETTFFEYAFTPTKLGYYEFYAFVDREDNILEWDDTNNEFGADKYIQVFEKLPDLEVTSVSINPVNDEGYAMVGVSSEVVATIVNSGIRDMTSSEGTKLEVSFYTSAPMATKLATVNVDQALAVGESVDITIPFKFLENAQYRVIAKVDEDKLITEEDENNNEKYKNIYAVSSLDSYVNNFSVVVGDGLAGVEHPLTFDLGMHNVPDEGTYRLHFNVSIDGTFGWGEVLELSTQNTTGFYPVGTGYSVSGSYAYIDFNSSYNRQTVTIPWIPDPSRSDTYNISVEVSSDINVDIGNDEVYAELTVEKLTTNILVESIKITESGGSATIKVTLGYPQGEQSDLDVEVGLLVYRASDYSEGNPPIDSLTVKSINGILRGDSRPISFTWAVSNGDYIFVAVVDPENKVKEINEADNSYPSLLTNFGTSEVIDDAEEEDEGLLGLPSISVTIAMSIFGLVALARRRS
ncbi:MAG: CARDB domain-containing protein [archaeon]|nr:CARDB domain-containing protein [archaeon]